jgi:hypothetical protein
MRFNDHDVAVSVHVFSSRLVAMVEGVCLQLYFIGF